MLRDPDYIKLPRLYVDHELKARTLITLPENQAHYLKNVLRKKAGEEIRVFNGRHGEWLCEITQITKKTLELAAQELLQEQPAPERHIHLFFAPIKKNRMDILVEKAVELGVTDIHPVLTQNTETRKINEDRIRSQIIEAAEQCERLNMPELHNLSDFASLIGNWNMDIRLYACLERQENADVLKVSESDAAMLIGPEGGFTKEEKETLLSSSFVQTVSLGKNILRAETAALKALSLIS